MKKVLFSSLVFGGLALTSCKKDYTCECKFNVVGVPGTMAHTFDINDAKKKDAEAGCTYKVPGVPESDVNMDCSVYETYQ